MSVLAADPTVQVTGWWTVVIALGSLCAAGTAIVMFVRKVMLPLASVVAELQRSFPILTDIAERFGQAGHETISAELQALSANDEIAAANQKAMMARLEAVSAKADAIDSKATALDLRLSETRHAIIGDIAGLRAGDAGAVTLVEQMERTSNDLQDVRRQLAAVAERITE